MNYCELAQRSSHTHTHTHRLLWVFNNWLCIQRKTSGGPEGPSRFQEPGVVSLWPHGAHPSFLMVPTNPVVQHLTPPTLWFVVLAQDSWTGLIRVRSSSHTPSGIQTIRSSSNGAFSPVLTCVSIYTRAPSMLVQIWFPSVCVSKRWSGLFWCSLLVSHNWYQVVKILENI